MGTKVAPAYANLFMRELEETLLKNHEYKPTVWWRYIDDIFFIWEHGESSLKEWTKYLNSAHQTIKFTEEFSYIEIPFLDTKVKVDHTGKLYTDLYSKPTDSHSYLRYDSAHPKMCKESLPYGQFLRVRRICTKKSDFKKHSKEMKQHFLNRGYPEGTLDKNIKSCIQTDRKTLLSEKTKTQDETKNGDKIFITTTFRPCKNSITDVIRKNWEILGRSKTTKNMYRSTLITSHKRPKNLRDFLVKARTEYSENTPNTEQETQNANTNACNKKNCKYCKMLCTKGSITDLRNNASYTTKHNITCNSSNLIYCIECKKCNKQYVGQTKRKIKDRIREHIYHTKKDTNSSDVPYHFNSNGHCGEQDMTIHILDFIYEHPESKRAQSLRNTIEYNWIQKLHSQSPWGLNTLDNRYG